MPGTRRIAHALPERLLALVLIASFLLLSGSTLAQATPAIDKAKAQAQALLNLIDKLDEELSAATEDYDYANQQLEDTQATVKRTTANITKAEKDLQTAQDQLNQRLVNIYKAGKLTMLGRHPRRQQLLRPDLPRRPDGSGWASRTPQLVNQVQGYKQNVADRKVELETPSEGAAGRRRQGRGRQAEGARPAHRSRRRPSRAKKSRSPSSRRQRPPARPSWPPRPGPGRSSSPPARASSSAPP